MSDVMRGGNSCSKMDHSLVLINHWDWLGRGGPMVLRKTEIDMDSCLHLEDIIHTILV